MLMLFDAWEKGANCVGADPESFFIKLTPRTTRQDRIRHETAMSLCETCPVKDLCLDFAIKNGLQGVFGGRYIPPRM